jgi:hypothetical protein
MPFPRAALKLKEHSLGELLYRHHKLEKMPPELPIPVTLYRFIQGLDFGEALLDADLATMP